MKTYKIGINETLNKIVDVQAESLAEALKKVRKAYYQGDIVLTADDFAGSSFTLEDVETY